MLMLALSAALHILFDLFSLLSINNMHEEEKVEFFHSESSFGSDSQSSESRYLDFNSELIAEAENIFATLRKELLPNQALNSTERIEYVLRRANILHKDTLPQQITYLRKIDAPQNAEESITNTHRRVGKLLEDYDRLTKGNLPYKEFYTAYAKDSREGGFGKKKEPLEIGIDQDAVIKPEYIEIAYSGDRHKLKGSTPRVFLAQPAVADKETTALKEEVYQLKRSLEETRKKNEQERIDQRLAFERRLKTYLAPVGSEAQNLLRTEVRSKSEQLTALLQDNKKLQRIIEQRDRIIEALKMENSSLNQQIILLRKTDSNAFDYQQAHNKSYNSQNNELSAEKRNEKRIKNLLQENQLLKNQLKTERQRLYRLQTDLTNEERRELDRSKRALQAKTLQLEELYCKLDQQRLENLQLTHHSSSASKVTESLKRENELFKSKLEKLEKTYASHPVSFLPLEPDKVMAVSRKAVSKVQIVQYEGEGVEGLQYYQNLSKEFRIRFKRACLRDKELLYKTNGIEIGIITNFETPNKIATLVHITNYTQGDFTRLKAKVINPYENKILGEEFQQQRLPSNDQIKVPVSLIITQYPIGPLILVLEYEFNEKKEEIRILLPAHIFKTMVAEYRSNAIANPIIINLIPERKICKELNDLRGYLKLPQREGPIRMELFNEHTHTLIAMDITQNKDGVELAYEHREGNRKITEYFIRTFSFLLSK